MPDPYGDMIVLTLIVLGALFTLCLGILAWWLI